jgi:hypothetical protein
MELVRHTEQELSKLAPGETLRLDLTLEDKVYAITYTDPAIFERVVVVSVDGEHRLIDWAASSLGNVSEGPKQLVLAGDGVSDMEEGNCAEGVGEVQQGLGIQAAAQQSVGGLAARIAQCKCPCCIEVAGHLVCCG